MAQHANLWGPVGISYPTGKPAASVSVTILRRPSAVSATLYTSKDKTIASANPLRTDVSGNLSFYADPGDYWLDFAGVRREIVVNDYPGDAGGTTPGTGSEPYVHEQTSVASVWGPIPHNLGYYPPAVSLFSLDFGLEYGGYVVQHLDLNTLRISMDIPTDGVALIR